MLPLPVFAPIGAGMVRTALGSEITIELRAQIVAFSACRLKER